MQSNTTLTQEIVEISREADRDRPQMTSRLE